MKEEKYDLDYNSLIRQKDLMSDKITSIFKRLQNVRKEIARPYIFALEKKFPNENTYELIKVADEDLQKSNKLYKKLTEKLIEIQRFRQGPFNELVELIKQIQP